MASPFLSSSILIGWKILPIRMLKTIKPKNQKHNFLNRIMSRHCSTPHVSSSWPSMRSRCRGRTWWWWWQTTRSRGFSSQRNPSSTYITSRQTNFPFCLSKKCILSRFVEWTTFFGESVQKCRKFECSLGPLVPQLIRHGGKPIRVPLSVTKLGLGFKFSYKK